MKLDILVIAVHPDDAELSCAGTILAHVAKGKKVGIVDLTRGEMGTRGTPEIRLKEAAEAAKILGVSVRDNLGMADGFFSNDREHQLQIVQKIRQYQPEILLANAITDRHPDHGRAAKLITDASFISGLKKLGTTWEGEAQAAWRPSKIFHFIQSRYIEPDFVVDISSFWPQKVKAIQAFQSQFFNEVNGNKGDQTFISTPAFLQFIEARARELGQQVGVQYAEGFTTHQPIAIDNMFSFL